MRRPSLRKLACRSILRGALLAMLSIGFTVAGFTVTPVPVFAVQPDEILSDPALEARAREISAELRCLVCQNQSIDDSNAPLARDLRLLVRERLTSGDSNRDVLDFVVARYGDFVLLRPPLKPETYLLWFSPIAILAFAVMLLVMRWRHAPAATPSAAPLTAEEQRQLDQVLGKAGRPAGETASDRASPT